MSENINFNSEITYAHKMDMLATNSSCIFGVNSNITLQMGFSKCKTYNFSGSSPTSQNVIKLQSKDAIFF